MRKVKRGTLKPEQSSLVISILPVIQSRGIKHPTAFLRRLGICPGTATKLLKGEAPQISVNHLTKICVNLNCTPNDLFARRDMDLPPKHALTEIERLKPVSDMKTVEEFLSEKSVVEVRGMLRR
jgi:DNA-binding Xre family transcriptional regulator